MFGFFKSLFSSRTETGRAPQQQEVAVTSVRRHVDKNKLAVPYNQQLIDSCKTDHRELLECYTQMMQAAESGDFTTVDARLKTLGQGLKTHFNKEFTELYTYLDLRTRKSAEPGEFERVRDFRMELQQIGVQINDIVNRYEGGVDAASLPKFIEDYKALGVALGDRIKREEEVLYPLYEKYGTG